MEQKISGGIYYEDGVPTHKGAVKIDGDIYYAGEDGVIATGHKVVHDSMTNGLLKHGSYVFSKDGKLVEGSYHPPKKLKKNFQENKSIIIGIIIVAILAVAAVLAVIFLGKTPGRPSGQPAGTVPAETEKLSVSLPDADEEVYLCTRPMERYLKGELSLDELVESGLGAYKPFEFRCSVSGADGGTLEFDGKTYELKKGDNTVSIDNLMTGKEYPYRVTVTADGEETVYDGTVKTADSVRFINLTGVKNTRDIGGYDTSFGKKVKQGLLIRGTELDGLVVNGFHLSDKEEAKQFGFRYDFDLRDSGVYIGEYKSPLGEVGHKFYSSPSYGGIFNHSNAETVREIFEDLANPDNYPMYMHCTYGTDRTGTIVFLLEGVLGVSEEQMRSDFYLSRLTSFLNKDNEGIDIIRDGLAGMKGETVNEKIVDYLTGYVGVTQEQIESIRNIFLGD